MSSRKATPPLPALMDARMIREETGLSKTAVRTMMVHLPKVYPAEIRRVFVRRADVEAALGLREAS
ncbi:MAG: hypothetical protein H0X39_15655 [Actinobacteria bacterium]|nr:hypothetical protein [Actinomycetota bacterium]